jgi:hypothetical protein
MMTPNEALERLERHLSKWPSASAWCDAHDVSRHLLSDVRAGRVPMSSAIAMAIGARKVTAYEDCNWVGYPLNPADYIVQ